MRLAVCTLSAVLLSGCSWLGLGGSEYASGYGTSGAYNDCGGAYGTAYQGLSYGQAGCDTGFGAGYGAAGYGAGYGAGAGAGYGAAGYGSGAGYGAGAGAGYGAAGYGSGAGYGAGAGAGYGAAGYGSGAGYGAGAGAGYGAAGYGSGAGYGAAGYGSGAGYGAGAGYNASTAAQGLNGYGLSGYQGATGYGANGLAGGAYGAGGVGGANYGIDQATGQPVLLGGNTAYGSAVGGYNVAGGYGAAGGVQTIQGAPIYVPQPYPAYYQAPRLRAGGSAMPFGFALFGGTSKFSDGNIFGGAIAKPASGSDTREVSALAAMDYADAFDDGETIGAAVEYDLSRDTTVFAAVSNTKYDGQSIVNGTITDVAGTEPGIYTFSDLEETTYEAGLRQYVGGNGSLRPYVGGSAGFVHNNDVYLTTSTDGGTVITTPEQQTYIREGWNPTAAGIIGAELAVGPNAAIGVETGIRWTDKRSTNLDSENTIATPLTVRGRMAF